MLEYRGDFEIEAFKHIINQHNEQSEKTSRKLQPQAEAIYHTHRAIDNFAANDVEVRSLVLVLTFYSMSDKELSILR